MNHWARMLADLPASAQRVIARVQRISLPRGADAATRLLRLRRGMCHAATVQVVYDSLDDAVQRALHVLRDVRGGLAPAELMARYGPVRSWTQLAADPQPHSVAEVLVLRGWLLLRPATPRHPARYLLPPELRCWLPRPLTFATDGAAPAPVPAPILAAAQTILRVCGDHPLTTRTDGTLTAASLRQITVPHIANAYALIARCFPLLIACGLIAVHQQQATLTMRGQQWLSDAPTQQWEDLHAAWLRAPQPDACLVALLPDRRGIDWPLLRRKLLNWVAALPVEQRLDAATLYPALAAHFGPLGDPHTHGFRSVDRAPWQPRRAAALFDAALRGPLTWFGFIVWEASGDAAPMHCAHVADPLAHLPSAAPAAPIPQSTPPTVVLTDTVVVQADPALLAAAVQARSVRRYLGNRLAPGVALVERAHVPALVQALERLEHTVAVTAAPPAEPLTPPSAPALAPGDCAALLVASAFYRRYGPADQPLRVHAETEQRLRASLSPALRTATETVVARLPLPAAAPHPTSDRAAVREVAPPDILVTLRCALQRHDALHIHYDTGGCGDWSERNVRPLELRQHGPHWYLRAYCLTARAERTFRVDRIAACTLIATRCRPGNTHTMPPPTSQPSSCSNQVVDRLNGHASNTEDLDAAHAGRIEPVQAHTVGIAVDQILQLPHERSELLVGQVALEHTILDVDAIALEQLEHLGPPLIRDDVVTNHSKHSVWEMGDWDEEQSHTTR